MKNIALLMASLALAACSQSPRENFAAAQKAYAAHDYRAARVHLAAGLSAEPRNPAMILLKARTLLALGDGDGAGQALAQLAGGAPPKGVLAELTAEAALLRGDEAAAMTALGDRTSVEAERLRAVAALQNRDMAGAAAHFAKGEAAGGSARLYADHARYALLTGDPAAAKALLLKAAAKGPNDLDTLLVGGQLALRGGDLGTALGTYSRALALYPESLSALEGKAAALGDLGRTDEMRKLVDDAANFAPKEPRLIWLRTRAAAAQHDWKAVRALVQPLEATLDPLDPLRQLDADALTHLGQPESAIAQLQPVVQAQPGNRDAIRLLAEAKLAAGAAGEAVATLRVLVNNAPRADELALMAKAAKAAGDPQAALWEARAKAPAPQALGHDLAAGDAAIRRGDWAMAIAAYERILAQTNGANPLVLNNMAFSQSMVGNHDKALAFAARALKAAPGNASVLDTAGYVRLRAGRDRVESLRLLREAAAKAPGNPAIRAHLAEAERAG